MSTDLSFLENVSLEPTKIPFSLGGRSFILREASEDAYTAYRNVVSKALHFKEGGGAYQDGGNEADTVLIQRCTFEVITNGQGGTSEVPVKVDFIRGLPRRITGPLYKKIREISGMDEDIETVEFLTKRIEADTKKLATLNKGESDAKNE